MLLSTTPVTYGKEVPGVGISIEPELDRETIFKKHSVDGQKMDALSAYQPEHDGWKVVRIKVGKYVYIVFVDISYIIAVFQVVLPCLSLSLSMTLS